MKMKAGIMQPEAQKEWVGMLLPPDCPFFSPPSLPSYFHEYLLITTEATKLNKTHLVSNLVEHKMMQTRTKKYSHIAVRWGTVEAQ